MAEIVRRVEEEGYVLLWSEVLKDLVAFYHSEADHAKIPPGFVPYSDAELFKLFGAESRDISTETLRMIHAPKKTGARITNVYADQDQGTEKSSPLSERHGRDRSSD